MKKKKRLLLVLTIITALCISNIIQAFAVGGNEETVSIEEFTNKMTELYKRYDLNFEVVDDSNYKPITKDILESELNKIEQELIDVIIYRNKVNEKILKLKEENKTTINESVTPHYMPININMEDTYKVTHASKLAHVTIAFKTSGQYDGSNGYFISVQSPGTWWNKAGLNYKGVDYDVKEWIKGDKQCYAHAEGIAKFEYTFAGVSITGETPFVIYRSFSSTN